MSVVTHRLKLDPIAFYAVRDGQKTFEVRLNDRHFQSGDYVELTYWDKNGEPGQKDVDTDLINMPTPLTFRIGWILGGGQYGLEPNHIAFTLEDPKTRPARIDIVTDMLTRLQAYSNEFCQQIETLSPHFTSQQIGAFDYLKRANQNAAKVLFIENLPVENSVSPQGEAQGSIQ